MKPPKFRLFPKRRKSRFKGLPALLLLLCACAGLGIIFRSPSASPTKSPVTATPIPTITLSSPATAARSLPTVAPTSTRPITFSTPNIIPTDTPLLSDNCPQGCLNQQPGCDIKGNINNKGEKIYHARTGRDYNKTKIDSTQGERWFCTIASAQANGWRSAEQ